MGETRSYRVFLPPTYATSQKRYPVIYWYHGYGERFNDSTTHYDDTGYGGDTIAAFVATHDVIVVKPDGYNPVTPGASNPHPYNIGPVETNRQFALYFPELVSQIDKTLRTIPDRNHRGITGFSMGGFMSLWIAGKYPDLVSSASAFVPSPEFFVGPLGFDVEYCHDDLYGNYDGVRTRLVTGSRDFIHYYHLRMESIWDFARPHFEWENFDSDHATPGIAKTFAFHMQAFAHPLPKPAVFNHADVYPNFTVWGWDVASDRREPGFTVLEDVSKTGFHSMVREWLPAGGLLPQVKLSIDSAPLYAPRSSHVVTYLRVRAGKLRRVTQKADAQGRLSFDLDGDDYEVGVSAGPLIAMSGYQVEGAAWATAGQPDKLRVTFWNKGGARSPAYAVRWESPNPGVKFNVTTSRLFGLAPGESLALPLTVTVSDPQRAIVQIAAVQGENRMVFDVPLFPAAQPVKDFQIADGRTVNLYQNAVKRVDMVLGEGNGDGHAAPGETFAVLLPDASSLRAAELFTNDACVDNTTRVSDSWHDYDHTGASVKYSLPVIRPECQPGHVVHMLARIVLPNAPMHHVSYATIEFPVWWRATDAATGTK